MCGRFTHPGDLGRIGDLLPGLEITSEIAERFNVAPSQGVPVVLNDGQRRLRFANWGLVPFWAKDPAIGNRMINARAETVHEKPAFRGLLKTRRCLILADGFYEWGKPAGSATKVPVYFRLRGGQPFFFAGLWDSWKGADEPLTTCTIITTTANDLVRPVHHRMPVILPADRLDAWIEPGEQPVEALRGMLEPLDPSLMQAYAVSRIVNSPANDSPVCREPAGGDLFG